MNRIINVGCIILDCVSTAFVFYFFKQKMAYEMRISDWSSDVCSSDLIPEEVTPALGPDATALGQIYWYTLEGRDPKTGKPTGGWDPHELRTLQDFYVKYALTSAQGVSEVASVGGFVKIGRAHV